MSKDVTVAHFPDRITIKRRRDEEPVDTLYIQRNKKAKPNNVVWTRLQDEAAHQSAGVAAEPYHVFAQVAESSNEPRRFRRWQDSKSNVQRIPLARVVNAHQHNGTPPHNRKVKSGRIERKRPQRYFAASSSSKLDPSEGEVLPGRHDSIREMLFTSKGLARAHKQSPIQKKADQPALNDHPTTHSQFSTEQGPARKRPIVSDVEAARRRASYQRGIQHSEDASARQCSGSRRALTRSSEGLVSQMQNFALENSRPSPTSYPVRDGGAKLKFKPKPPRPRQLDHDQEYPLNVDESRLEDDANYVYDVFVRNEPAKQIPMGPKTSFTANSGISEGQNVGILFLANEDDVFEDGLSDVASSEGQWSGEDDENAEDYFANEYPDEESDSDEKSSNDSASDAKSDINVSGEDYDAYF